MRKEKNTIKLKKKKKKKDKEKKMKKILIIFALVSLASCSSIKDGTSGIKKMNDTCPPQDERTLKHIFCKEAK